MLKTNVIKHDYKFVIRNTKTKETMEISILAESLDSAKLKIEDGWEVVKCAEPSA